MPTYYFLFLLLFIPYFLSAQNIENTLEDLGENIANDADALDAIGIMTDMTDILENPIAINYAEKEELSKLLFLNEIQIEEIIHHRKQYGYFHSIYELQQLPSFDIETLKRIRPYISFDQKLALSTLQPKKEGMHYVLSRFGRNSPKGKGYLASENGANYVGSPWYWQSRIKSQIAEKYKANLLIEKDAGEKGMDFISGTVQFPKLGRFKNTTLGNYQLRFGQGLLLGGGFRLTASAHPIQAIFTTEQQIFPHTVALEYGYLQGVTTQMKWKKFSITPFISYRKIDAISDDFGMRISDNGLHRTENEVKKKDQLSEILTGVHFQKALIPQLRIGATYLFQHFSDKLVQANDFSDQKDFEGKKNQLASIDVKANYQNMSIKSEVAFSSAFAWGYSASVVKSFSKAFQLGFLHRNFSARFHSFYGRSFSKNTSIQNEKGSFLTLLWRPSKRMDSFLYMDIYEFPWLKKYDLQTENGADFFLRINWKWKQKQRLQFRLRYQEKNEYSTALKRLSTVEKYFLRWTYKNETSEKIMFSTHVGGRTDFENQQNLYGFMLAQDVRYKWRKFQVDFRCAYYHTDTYDLRFYLWEPSMLYQYAFETYAGEALRTAFVIRYKYSKKWQFWFKYSLSNFFDRTQIGSGNELVEGHQKHSFDFQLMYKI